MGFKLGQTVFLKTDADQRPNIVVAKREFYGGTVVYTVSSDGAYIDVYSCELTEDRNELIALGIHTEE